MACDEDANGSASGAVEALSAAGLVGAGDWPCSGAATTIAAGAGPGAAAIAAAGTGSSS